MDKFCFILGKNPLLSLAEIFSVANYYQTDFQIIDLTSEILVIQTEELPAGQWQSRLGGTIKICIIVKSFNKIDELAAYLSPDNLKGKLFNQHKKKIIFGFSLYGNKFINQKKKFNSIGPGRSS